MQNRGMERPFEKQLDETSRMPGVQGVICVDSNGLLLGVRGRISKFASGPVSSLTELASTLHPKLYSGPVVVVESQQGKTLIKQEDGITTAVFRT